MWPVIVGTLGGTAVGGLITWWIERARWIRSEGVRWIDERRRLYVRFLDACEAVLRETAQQSMTVDSGVHADSVTAMQRVSDADRLLRETHLEIELIGGKAEISAASRLRRAVWELSSVNSALPDAPWSAADRERKLHDAGREWDKAHQAFKDAARRSLQPLAKDVGS